MQTLSLTVMIPIKQGNLLVVSVGSGQCRKGQNFFESDKPGFEYPNPRVY